MPPPDTRRGPSGGPWPQSNIELAGFDNAPSTSRCFRSGCTCSICCSVDEPAAARVRASSPTAEYVARRALYGPKRCACRTVVTP